LGILGHGYTDTQHAEGRPSIRRLWFVFFSRTAPMSTLAIGAGRTALS